MNIERPMTGAERARKWRAAMRAKGFRPRTFWLPDTSTEEFKQRARESCEAINRWYAAHPDEVEDMLALQYWPPDDEASSA